MSRRKIGRIFLHIVFCLTISDFKLALSDPTLKTNDATLQPESSKVELNEINPSITHKRDPVEPRIETTWSPSLATTSMTIDTTDQDDQSNGENSAEDEFESSIKVFKIHQYVLLGWSSLFVVLIGLVGNMVSLIVLSQKQMLKYTINKYLICLSLSDLMSLSIISILIPLRYILVSHRVIGFFEFHAFVFPYLYPLAATLQLSSIFLTMAACTYRTIKVYSFAPLEYLLRSTQSAGNLSGSGSASGSTRRASQSRAKRSLTKRLTSTNLTTMSSNSQAENSVTYYTQDNENEQETSTVLGNVKRTNLSPTKRFSMKNQTGKIIFFIYFVAFVLCLPYWFKYRRNTNPENPPQTNFVNGSAGLNETNIMEQGGALNSTIVNTNENTSNQNDNTFQSLNIIHTLVVTILSYIIPFMVLFVMNLLLIIALINKRKRKENLQQPSYQQVRQNPSGAAKQNRRINNTRSNKNETRVTFMLVMIVLLFLFCQMPNFFVHLLNVSKKVQELHMLSVSSSNSMTTLATTPVIPTTTIQVQAANNSSLSFTYEPQATTEPVIVSTTVAPEAPVYQERITFIHYLHQWANFLLIFNYSFNFCIYCLFNSQFRKTARCVFNLKKRPRRATDAQSVA